MADLQFDVATRNARLDAIESSGGVSPTLEIRTGAKPANCAAADTGTVVATIALPADWLQNAAGGVKSMSGTWSDNAADADGISAHFRFKRANGSTFQQGTVTLTGGGGVMQVDNVNFKAGQQFNITQFDIKDGNE